MELNIGIVDDSLSDSLRLKSFVRSWVFGNGHQQGRTALYSSGEDILRSFSPGIFHVVFMDIIMDSINGVQAARLLRDRDTDVLIVFTTTSKEYAFEAFPVHPFDYVVKPYGQKEVSKVLNEAVRVLSAHEQAVTIRSGRAEYTIPMGLVSSVTAQGHTAEITLTDGRSILTSMKFRDVEELFCSAEDSCFLLCNRGVIVNMSHISSQEHGVFVMKDGKRFPIRVNGGAKVRAAFAQYIITNMRGGRKCTSLHVTRSN